MCGLKSSEISLDTRHAIIKQFQAGNSQKKISRDLSISRTTIQSIIYKFQQTNSVENKGHRGRKSKWTNRDTNLLLRLVKSKRKLSFKNLCKEFNNNKELKYSQTTIRRHLRQLGFKRRVLKKNKLIRTVNRQKRMKFCKEKINWSIEQWKNVIFSDETMVVVGNDQKLYVWQKSDEKYAPHLICHESKKRIAVMFWGCVTSKGVGALVPVSGTVDSQKYIEILENYLRPSISWYFGDDAVTLQQDNAPCHVSRVVQEYLNENDIFTIEWPAQSPDLNIIENIWLSIKRKLHSETSEVKSEEDLIERFRHAWNEITQLELDNLYASLPSRCKDVIFMKGHMSKY